MNNKVTMLVIEDNDMFRRLAVEMLSDYICYTAKNMKEGLAKINEVNPDMVFIDIGLPDGSGHQILSEIKSKKPQIFAVMLTISNLKQDVQASLKGGADGYIVKPFSRKQIKECIDKYNQSKTK